METGKALLRLEGQEGRQKVFAELVAQGMRPYDAAIAAGYSEARARHWREMVALAKELGHLQVAEQAANEAIRDEYREVLRRAQKDVVRNFEVRQQIRDNPKAPANARLQAAAEIDRLAGFEAASLQRDPEFNEILALSTEEVKAQIRIQAEKMGLGVEQLLDKFLRKAPIKEVPYTVMEDGVESRVPDAEGTG